MRSLYIIFSIIVFASGIYCNEFKQLKQGETYIAKSDCYVIPAAVYREWATVYIKYNNLKTFILQQSGELYSSADEYIAGLKKEIAIKEEIILQQDQLISMYKKSSTSMSGMQIRNKIFMISFCISISLFIVSLPFSIIGGYSIVSYINGI